MSNKENKTKLHYVLTGTGWALLAIFVAAILIHFSWNMAMPELFGAAKMSFKNAFGLVILAAMVAGLFGRRIAGRHVGLSRHTKVRENA